MNTTEEKVLYADLELVKERLYDRCGFTLTDLKVNAESVAYGACSFKLNGQTVEHRTSNITPTKTGQFVTLWKRNKNGVTQPFDSTDAIDIVVITSKSVDTLGQFIFPTSVLVGKGIISQPGKEGKRGIRVYPPWDVATSKQAEKTQQWQVEYFVTIKGKNITTPEVARRLFNCYQ